MQSVLRRSNFAPYDISKFRIRDCAAVINGERAAKSTAIVKTRRVAGRRPGEPAITSPLGSRLGLENWKRSVRWREAIVEIGRPTSSTTSLRP